MDDEAMAPVSYLLGFLLIMAVAAFWLWSILDAAKRPHAEWRAAGQSKPLWLGIMIGVGIIGCGPFSWLGSLMYVVVARPALKRASSAPPGAPDGGFSG